MFITGGAPHKPTFAVIVGYGDACEMGTTVDVELGVAILFGSGVHVAGISKGATVRICSAGPRGCCHFPCHNQIAKAPVTNARMERNARIVFWILVITKFIPRYRSHLQEQVLENRP